MKPEEIQDRFVKVPLDLLRGDNNLDENEKLVWIVLQSRADNETGVCNPSIKSIAADAGISERAVYNALYGIKKRGGLEERGWIKITKRSGRRSEYCPLLPRVSRRLKSGDVSLPLQKAVPDCHADTTSASGAGVCTQTQFQTSYETTPLHGVHTTSAWGAGQVLDPSSKSKKINRGTSSKRTRTKQSQSPDFSASFDSESGHFLLGAAARQKLLDDFPNVDLDATLKIIEARRLSDTKAQPIQNVLAYLEKCLMTHGCVMRAGALMTFDDGSTGRVKVYTDEELNQREQREKARLSSPVSKALEDLAAKWRSS